MTPSTLTRRALALMPPEPHPGRELARRMRLEVAVRCLGAGTLLRRRGEVARG